MIKSNHKNKIKGGVICFIFIHILINSMVKNNGNANKQDKFIYPIRYNKKKNAKIFEKVYGLDDIVSTISS